MKLKIWNGRWGGVNNSETIYACGYSVRDVIEMIEDMNGYPTVGMKGEIRKYWNRRCWGRSMDGIIPERGLWIAKRGKKPKGVYPK